MDISADDKFIVVGALNGKVRVYDLERNQIVCSIDDQPYGQSKIKSNLIRLTLLVSHVKFTRDGTFLITAYVNLTMKMFNVQYGQQIGYLRQSITISDIVGRMNPKKQGAEFEPVSPSEEDKDIEFEYMRWNVRQDCYGNKLQRKTMLHQLIT